MGWRNVGRNPTRTILACFAIAIAQVTLIWINSFMNGDEAKIFETLTGPMLGHIQVHSPHYRDDEAIEPIQEDRNYIEIITPDQFRAGIERAIAKGWLSLHESWT
jgi:ABC-type lipoprotein release transport system permease subunit